MRKYQLYLTLSMLILFNLSCAKDKIDIDPVDCVETVTYDNQIKPIIDQTCAIAGCHVSGANVPGIFTNYNGLSPFLSATLFQTRALTLRDMPPVYSAGPTSLSVEQLELITCWVEQGYLEN